jgi:hypothetical protein
VADWKAFCRTADDMTVDGDAIVVTFPDERSHRVVVEDANDAYELSAVVARPGALYGIDDVPLRAWRRNRATQLLGFRLDRKGRLVGEAWAPKLGLSREEFLNYVRRVATECDLFEYHLTGKDRE